MFHGVLQAWGGIFYLLNKVFFSRAERSDGVKQQTWRIRSWTVYIIGLPAWVIIFVSERNWMVASVEAGGAVVMVFGLVVALRGIKYAPRWLSSIARIAAIAGIAYSIHDFGGITQLTQVLELGIVAGFLIGTYLLAKQRPTGYLWFILMNCSNAILMGVEHYPWLVLQQIASLGFVMDAYFIQRHRARLAAAKSRTV